MNSQRPFRLLSLSGGFWVAVVLGMMGSLCIVLISTSVGGAQGWVNIAVGGAWGAIGAVAIFLGWNVVGPVLVGAADPAARAALFVDSFLARLLAFVVVSPLVILLIRLFTHSSEAFQLQAPAALTAMARTRPSRASGAVGVMLSTKSLISPPMIAVSAAAEPR